MLFSKVNYKFRCAKCNSSWDSNDEYFDLPLNIRLIRIKLAQNKNEVDLSEMVKEFISEEKLPDDFWCERCNSKSPNSTKAADSIFLSPILTFSINRFVFNSNFQMRTKMLNKVKYTFVYLVSLLNLIVE